VQVRPARPIEARVPWASAAPVIDGAFEEEESWQGAARLEPFTHTVTGDGVPEEVIATTWAELD